MQIAAMALKPSAVRDEPLITPVPLHKTTHATRALTNDEPATLEGERGDILVRGLWKNQHETKTKD